MNTRSLRFQLMGWYATLVLAGFSAFGVYTYFEVRHFLQASQLTTLYKRAERLGDFLLADVDRTGEAYVASETRARFSPETDDRFIRVLRPDRSVLYLSGVPVSQSFDPAKIALPQDAIREPIYREETISPNFRILVMTVPYMVNHRQYLIEMGSSSVSRDQIMRKLLISLCAGLPIVVGGAVWAGYLLIGKSLAPVRRVIHAANEITLRHLERRLPAARTGDEIEELIMAMNGMIHRLHQSFQHASRFSADASHELRTPLTIIRGELEAALQSQGLNEGMREKIGSILEETERLAKIVEGLFAVSNLEAGEATFNISRFDFAGLVATTAEQMELLAKEKSIHLDWDTGSCVEIEGDRFRLKQVVVNLLDNAIKYTPDGGNIRLTARAESGKALFQVADSGPGIGPESLPFIFDRFFRSNAVRFSEHSGAGLGLSIVRSICTAHGGTVTAENQAPSGCCFTVQLPLPVEPSKRHLYPTEAI